MTSLPGTVAGNEVSAAGRAFAVPVETVAWIVAGALFLVLRLGPVWQAPVAGAELEGLSGAWQARLGESDPRFVPTLFQALSAFVLRLSSSEVGPRLLAFAGAAMVPLVLYRLRDQLGRAGGLLALFLLAIDPPLLSFGAGASAMAFDIPLTLGLAWLLLRGPARAIGAGALAEAAGGQPAPAAGFAWRWAAGGLLVSLAGPVTLPLLAAAAALRLGRRDYPAGRNLLSAALGGAAGVGIASFRFGLGPGGLRIPPLDLFGDSFTQTWSTTTGFEVIALYTWPLIAGGLAAAGWYAWRWWAWREVDATRRLLLTWALFAGAWALAAGTEHAYAASAALSLPLALLLGPALDRALRAMAEADWLTARFALPGAAFVTSVAFAYMLDWARTDRMGSAGDKAIVILLLLAAVAMLGLVAWNRESRPALLAAGLAVGALAVFPGTLGVALSGSLEPIPSPVSPPQARALRDAALLTVHDRPGVIVVHPQFRDALTWPFRDSGAIVVSSRVPADASFVIWPREAAKPERMTALEGDWVVLREVSPPTASFLRYLRWLSNRNSLRTHSTVAAVYTRTSQ